MINEMNIPLEEDGIEEEILVDEEVAITKAMWGDISGNIANQTDLQNALDAKQNSLTEAQLNAVNSGITTEKVTTYDDYADQIASKANQSALNTEATTREQADTALGRRIDDEATARQQADNGLQTQIDAITSKSDVVDVVANYAALQAYDTSSLGNNDVIKVLDDETHEDALTYYRWSTTTQTWIYIGQEAPYYSKGQMDIKLAEKQDKIDATHKLSADLVDDSTTTNKFVTAEDKTTWNAKQNALTAGTGIDITSDTVGIDESITQTISGSRTLLSSVSQSGSNQLNLYTLYPYGFLDGSGQPNPSATSYWCTELIPIEITSVDDRWVVGNCFYEEDYSVKIYKLAYYNANGEYIRTVRADSLSANHNISMLKSSYPDVSNYKYIRLQFAKSQVPYEKASKVLYWPGNSFFDKNAYTPFNSVTSLNIGAGEVYGANLESRLNGINKYNALKNGIMPFDKRDLSNGRVRSTDGESGQASIYRLSTTRKFIIPKGTTISLPTNDYWDMASLSYKDDGTYIATTDWVRSVYYAQDTSVRLTFKRTVDGNDDGTLYTNEKIEELLSKLIITNEPQLYTYSGSKISLGNTLDATITNITTMHQDSAIYGDKIITFSNDGTYKVVNLNGKTLYSGSLDQSDTIKPHANSVCFGTERYDGNDAFPLLYVNAYNNAGLPKGTCYVYRLKNDYSTTLLLTIQIGFTTDNIWSDGNDIRPYGNFLVDTDNDKLYVYTMKDDIQKVRVFRFSLPTLSQGSAVTLATTDIEEYFDVDYLYIIQGGCYCNGKLYVSSGNDNSQANSSKLSVINLTTKTIESSIELSQFFAEPETVFVHNGRLYVGESTLWKLKF